MLTLWPQQGGVYVGKKMIDQSWIITSPHPKKHFLWIRMSFDHNKLLVWNDSKQVWCSCEYRLEIYWSQDITTQTSQTRSRQPWMGFTTHLKKIRSWKVHVSIKYYLVIEIRNSSAPNISKKKYSTPHFSLFGCRVSLVE